MEKKIIRCAVYTRKSTEEGLEMEYNSLDAQREAGEKYIEAMKHEGWRLIPEFYDDGGFSGGNMDRPALNRLISDIKSGRIDMVVVYKIDRMSRALTDFSKLMEVFDEHKTSFVSVTQHFNTQDSMGRLTLNILLSFAQFEREVTGERIRDKFAASKIKGMWMGGPPPLGYDVLERKLIVNKEETKIVKHIFERFIALGSMSLLATELNKNNYRTKSYVSQTGNNMGGNIFTLNTLRTILKNKLYIGEIHHKGKYYTGQHQATVAYDVFEEAQKIFKESSSKKRQRTWKIKSEALLKGIIFCGGCSGAMSPTHTCKGNKKYRYYIGNGYRRHMCDACSNLRIPAGEIENVIISQLKTLFTDPEKISSVFQKVKKQNNKLSEYTIHEALNNTGQLWEALLPIEQKRIVHLLIERILVKATGLDIEYRAKGFEELINKINVRNFANG